MRKRFGPVLSALLVLGVAACDSLPFLGATDEEKLPGTRIPVLLSNDGRAAVDTGVEGVGISVPPAEPLAAWAQAGGVPAHALGNVAGPSGLRQAWSTSIGDASDERPILSAPVVAEGKVFAVDGRGRVGAFGASGQRLWTAEPYQRTPDRLAGGGIAYDGGRVYVTLAPGEVVALSAADGSEAWRQAIRVPLRAPPTVAGGLVLVRTADNQLWALNAANGQVVWRHAGIFETAGLLGGSSPAVEGGTVVVTYSSGEVFALGLADGRPIWSETVQRARRGSALDSLTDIVAAPVVDRGLVFVAGAGGETAALDQTRGQRAWAAPLTGYGTPWVAGDAVYLVTAQGELVCLLRETGRVRWVTSLGQALQPEGTPSGTLWAGPIMVGGRLVVTGTTGDVAAFEPRTGALVERASVGDAVRLPPVVADGALYVLSEGGELTAFR